MCLKFFILIIFILSISISAEVEFEKVAVILERNCLSCHNPDKKKGKLDLTTRESMLLKKRAVIPGKPDSSLLIESVVGEEPEMPPKGASLNSEEVKILKAWIAAGAQWPKGRKLEDNPHTNSDWWSLKPIKKSVFAGNNPVDYFTTAHLKQKGLIPNKSAPPEILIRRITYDLTGLPPTPEEIDVFVKAWNVDPDKAWTEKVDGLLASESFGEKWAQHWLDVARYADTHGYDKDKLRRNAWPYRDYVIRSINEDKSYVRFVQEQVAGDVIYPGTEDGVIGLGFLAAGPWDFVGHVEVSESKVDGKIARHSDRDEMISTVFNVFQSTTVQCAQCHHHKFDPIRMEDYYRLHAVFAAVDRADRMYAEGTPNDIQRKKAMQARVAKLKKERAKLQNGENPIAEKTKKKIARIREIEQIQGKTQKPEFGYHSKIVKDRNEQKWVQLDLKKKFPVTKIRLMPCYDDYNNIGAGFGFPVRYRVEVSNDRAFKKGVKLIYASKADVPNPACKTQEFKISESQVQFVRITATKMAERSSDFIFSLAEVEVFGSDENNNFARHAAISSKDSIEAGPRWRRSNLTDGIYHEEKLDKKLKAELDSLRREVKASTAPKISEDTSAKLKKLNAQLRGVNRELERFPKGKVVYAAATHFKSEANFIPTNGKKRAIHLLHRGDIKNPGKKMKPGAPALWEGTKEVFTDDEKRDESESRRDLALYLTSGENPLLWRSMVNRLWLWTFGSGLVKSPNDFGRMGMKPTHPKLLDYLAAQLRDDPKHSLKSIVRTLVLSQTYQRASDWSQSNAGIDAGNEYLWRYNRRRLTAEEFRDSLLYTSGKLIKKKYGPGFFDFVLKKTAHSPHYEYHLHNPADVKSHRRTVYRFVVRSQPQPMLTTLDCADPSLSVPKRDESTTALQALAQWNNKFVEAMAGYMAEQIKGKNKESLHKACVTVLGRKPSLAEEKILLEQLQKNGAANLARILFNMSAFTYVD